MSTEDTYLRSVERQLSGIASEHRTDVLEDLRGHFADAEEAGRSVDDTIRGLGTPAEIAARAREEFGETTDAAEQRAERGWKVLQGAALVVAVLIGVVVAFIMRPQTGLLDGGETSAGDTYFEENGLLAALTAAAPALLVAAPLAFPRRLRLAVAIACAALLTVGSLVGGLFVLGSFFLPPAMLAWAALIVWARQVRTGFGFGWRIAGGVLAALPALGAFGTLFNGGASVGLELMGWVIVAVVLALAVMIVLGHRWAGWVLAAIGAAALITGLISGGLLTLAFVWLGGWWLTIGLAHAVAAPRS